MPLQLVEKLLSTCETLEQETAQAIADAAMLEVARITVGHMVLPPFPSHNLNSVELD